MLFTRFGVLFFRSFVWFYLEKKRSKRFDCDIYLGFEVKDSVNEVEGKETRLVWFSFHSIVV